MQQEASEVAAQTLDLLEWRLRRLEFALHGGTSKAAVGELPVNERLRKLESLLQQLSRRSDVLSAIVYLRRVTPDIFDEEQQDASYDLDPKARQTMVNTEAPSFSTTAAQLKLLSDTPLPPTDSFAALTALQPRINKALQRQAQQAEDISSLRKSTGSLVLRWHDVNILGQGRCWAEWDERLRTAERSVRREEVRRQREQAGV